MYLNDAMINQFYRLIINDLPRINVDIRKI